MLVDAREAEYGMCSGIFKITEYSKQKLEA